MDASSLSNITQEEFENNVEKAIQELPESPSSPRARSSVSEASMSPFATSPGEEPARQLALPATAAALDGTKRFFQRTGDAAKEAVSRPLGAISRILDNMNQPGYESESGDSEGEENHTPRRQQQQQPQPPSRLLAQLGISPAGSEGWVDCNVADCSVSREPTPTPGYHQYPGNVNNPHAHLPPPPHPHQLAFVESYAEHEQALANATEASQDDYAREQAHNASVTTLHQMFPDLDEEIVEAVLVGCGGDLGVAIDRLLEM